MNFEKLKPWNWFKKEDDGYDIPINYISENSVAEDDVPEITNETPVIAVRTIFTCHEIRRIPF